MTLVWILSALVIPVLLTEFSEIAPWLAQKTLKLAARLLSDPIDRIASREEWVASVEATPGKLLKLLDALSILVLTVPRRWVRHGLPWGKQARLRTATFRLIEEGVVQARHGALSWQHPVSTQDVYHHGRRVDVIVDCSMEELQWAYTLPDEMTATCLVDLILRLPEAPLEATLAALDTDFGTLSPMIRRWSVPMV